MSSGLYALVGVLLGGGVTAAVQIGLALFNEKRAHKAEWKIAVRMVSEELLRLMIDMRSIVENGTSPLMPTDDRFLSTALWEEYRTVIARELPDDAGGEAFWRTLAAINSTSSHGLRPALQAMPPGTQLDETLRDGVRDGFVAAWGLYEFMNDGPPQLQPPKGIEQAFEKQRERRP